MNLEFLLQIVILNRQYKTLIYVKTRAAWQCGFLKTKQALSAPQQFYNQVNNKQNSKNIFRKLVHMDGQASSQQRKPPRSLKHIQTQSNSENSSIINVNALLEKNKTQICVLTKKVEKPDTTRDRQEPTQQLKFKKAIQMQIQQDVECFLMQSRKKNKKRKMLHKKQGRRFSNPDDFSSLKNM